MFTEAQVQALCAAYPEFAEFFCVPYRLHPNNIKSFVFNDGQQAQSRASGFFHTSFPIRAVLDLAVSRASIHYEQQAAENLGEYFLQADPEEFALERD